MPSYQKHLIKCRCVLQQYKKLSKPPLHQFLVFSELDDEGNVKLKFAQCNNCGIVHKIKDVCTSDIVEGKEDLSSLMTIDDIKKSLPDNIVNILDNNDCSLPLWEQAKFIIENQSWGDIIPLSSEIVDGMRQGKYLRILGNNLHKVESYLNEEYLNK